MSVLRNALMVGAAALAFVPAAYAQQTAAIEDVVVIGLKEAYRGDVSLQEMPQSTQIIPAEVLGKLNITRLDQALDFASGVSRQNAFGGAWDAYAIRGFAGDENSASGFLVNGFVGGRGYGGPRDTVNVERIEILKGPTSALFGRGEPGGSVNLITKKPKFEQEGTFNVSAGSFRKYRVDGDYTGPLVGDKVAFRINGAYENSHSFRDTLKFSKWTILPSVLARITEDTILTYELEATKQKFPFDRGIVAINGDPSVLPVSRFLGEPGDGQIEANVLGHQLGLQQNLSADWTLLLGFSYRDTDLYGFGQDPEFAAGRNPFFTDGRTLSRRRISRDYATHDAIPRGEVSGRFDTGPVTHHFLAGTDYEYYNIYRYKQNRYRPPAFNATSTLATLNAVDIFSPVYGNIATLSPLTDRTEKDKSWGFYAHDQIDITDELKIHAGFRYDNFKQRITDQLPVSSTLQHVKKTSPTVGAGYQITPAIMLYASWGKGFRPNIGANFARVPFAPENTESYEAGAKFQSADGKLTGSVAAYHMKKTNILTADPVNAGFSIAVGEAKSRGIEAELSGEIAEGLRVWINYAYTDAEIAKDFADPSFARPLAKGTPLINIAPHSASILVTKEFQVYEHPLTVGGGLNFVDKRLGETGANYFLPSYTLVRLVASYEITDNLVLSGEVRNLFDKKYYPSSYAAIWTMPGAPREFSIKATYKF